MLEFLSAHAGLLAVLYVVGALLDYADSIARVRLRPTPLVILMALLWPILLPFNVVGHLALRLRR